MREHLEQIARLLRENGELTRAAVIEDLLAGTDDELNVFLSSNDLWGGSGSIADCALGGGRSPARRELEHLLIRLGSEQISSGILNQRTAMWVEAFSKWERMKL
jgi:hypothetical protein